MFEMIFFFNLKPYQGEKLISNQCFPRYIINLN